MKNYLNKKNNRYCIRGVIMPKKAQAEFFLLKIGIGMVIGGLFALVLKLLTN